jgi:hypothetical protein
MKDLITKAFSTILVVCLISTFCISNVNTVYAQDADTDVSTEVNSAKEQMEEEENYIVALVSQRTGENLTTSDWKICLNYLRENYNSITTEIGIDVDKVKSYVSAYTYVELEEEEPDEKINYIVEARAAYSPSKVTAYTNKYWNSHNSAYPNFESLGGDCANFVSQALHAGGKSMKGTDASNFSNWFCRTSSTNQLSKVSSTWRGADAFGHYWMANAKKYKKFGASYFSSADSFKTVYNYGSVGDAISVLNSNGRPYHTLIISYKEDGKLKFASHTDNHKWKSLYNYIREAGKDPVRIYKM